MKIMLEIRLDREVGSLKDSDKCPSWYKQAKWQVRGGLNLHHFLDARAVVFYWAKIQRWI